MEVKFSRNRVEIISNDFDIEQIADSGQSFMIDRVACDFWQVLAFNKKLMVKKHSQTFHELFCSEKDYREIWEKYFDFETDYGKIKAFIETFNDPYLSNAVRFGFGIRILRQELFETIVSFIISQQNNIPRIKNLIKKLCQPNGDRFPDAETLAKYSESDLKNLGFGYRAKYIRDIAAAVQNGKLNLDSLKQMDFESAIKYLKGFNGIGDKVANCISLFGLHKTEAFPKDVWVKRIIAEKYAGFFDHTVFKNYAGIVQQYMFFYQRSSKQQKSD